MYMKERMDYMTKMSKHPLTEDDYMTKMWKHPLTWLGNGSVTWHWG